MNPVFSYFKIKSELILFALVWKKWRIASCLFKMFYCRKFKRNSRCCRRSRYELKHTLVFVAFSVLYTHSFYLFTNQSTWYALGR